MPRVEAKPMGSSRFHLRSLGSALLALSMLSFLGAPAALAQDEDSSAKALEILKKADAAIKQVSAVRFESKIVPAGLALNFIAPAEGKGVMSGWTGQSPERFWAYVETGVPGSEEKKVFEGGGHPEMFFVIDHGTKKAYADMDPAVFGSAGNTLNSLGMVEYVHSAPFDDEIAAETKEYRGQEDVAGLPCNKVNVVYSGGRGESTWYFGTEDNLPRRRVRHFKSPQGDGSIDIVLTSLEVDPKVDAATFELQLPEGYEQVDDFAP